MKVFWVGLLHFIVSVGLGIGFVVITRSPSSEPTMIGVVGGLTVECLYWILVFFTGGEMRVLAGIGLVLCSILLGLGAGAAAGRALQLVVGKQIPTELATAGTGGVLFGTLAVCWMVSVERERRTS